MAETIDEATIIAWVDGELDAAEGARVAEAVAADPALAALAEGHRRMKARFAAAFAPLAQAGPTAAAVPSGQPGPKVVSLAAVRAERAAQAAREAPPRPWGKHGWMGGAIAASLVAGLLIGHGAGAPAGVADKPQALALAAPIARALDGELSGGDGPVRITLSFRDAGGHYCRSFAGRNLAGVACRDAGAWQLRYGAPVAAGATDYRMAGGDGTQAQVVAAMIVGDPLDRAGETAARQAGWR